MSATARQLRKAAKRYAIDTALRISGCICEPNIVHTGTDRVRIEHDSWCGMIDHPSQLLIFRLPPGCER